mmetsp:Transcript_3822/g.6495  ORF Transcript_3822/g.6495 Transcript_3822/m.6495 type:complete len:346 (-) Transcript_3822:28-1065(-)
MAKLASHNSSRVSSLFSAANFEIIKFCASNMSLFESDCNACCCSSDCMSVATCSIFLCAVSCGAQICKCDAPGSSSSLSSTVFEPRSFLSSRISCFSSCISDVEGLRVMCAWDAEHFSSSALDKMISSSTANVSSAKLNESFSSLVVAGLESSKLPSVNGSPFSWSPRATITWRASDSSSSSSLSDSFSVFAFTTPIAKLESDHSSSDLFSFSSLLDGFTIIKFSPSNFRFSAFFTIRIFSSPNFFFLLKLLFLDFCFCPFPRLTSKWLSVSFLSFFFFLSDVDLLIIKRLSVNSSSDLFLFLRATNNRSASFCSLGCCLRAFLLSVFDTPSPVLFDGGLRRINK